MGYTASAMSDSTEQPRQEPLTNVQGISAPRARLAVGWSRLLAGYSLLVVLLALLRLHLVGWGLLLTCDERNAIYLILIVHTLLGVAPAISAWFIMRDRRDGRTALRLLAVATPFFMLASVDRICAFFIPPVYGRTTLFLRDRELGWRHRPGAQGEWAGPVKINGKGLRGPEVPYAKPEGEFRIIFLGDSVAFALRTAYEEGFVARIEKTLDERPPTGRVATVNMSVSGYSPWQELILLERYGLKYKPDLVVQCFCLNDVTEKLNLLRFGGDRLGFEAAMAATGPEWSGIFRLARRARVWFHLGADVRQAAGEMADREVWDLVDKHDSEFVRQAWSLTRDNMRKIVKLCRAHEVPLAVVCFPYAFQLDREGESDHPQRVLRRFCETEGVPFLDLLPAMRAHHRQVGERIPLFFDRNHPTSEGHAFVADHILAFFEREGLLPLWVNP